MVFLPFYNLYIYHEIGLLSKELYIIISNMVLRIIPLVLKTRSYQLLKVVLYINLFIT